jgi:hypothetical protein
MTMTAAIRATESQDLPAIAKFLLRVYQFDPSDRHADTQFLEWKYLGPRPGWKGSRSYLLEKDGKIVAHCGICPVIFHLQNGKTVDSLTMMDWAADPASPGVGVSLFRQLMELAPTSFIIGGAPNTRLIVPRIGFRPVGEALTYAAWLRPWREFRIRPHTRKSALLLLHGLTHPARDRRQAGVPWDSVPVTRFDDSILPLLIGAKRTGTICTRTLADLNYLLTCPYPKVQGFLLTVAGQIRGYFVLGKAEWEARLLDLVVDSADSSDWSLAYGVVTRAAQSDPEICRIRILTTTPALSEALALNGYWCQYKEPIVIHDPSQFLDGAFPIDFQFFDGDSGY